MLGASMVASHLKMFDLKENAGLTFSKSDTVTS